MRRKSYAKALDEALRPFGFTRSGDDWVRIRGDWWECVNRQQSWLGGVTVNLEMKDLETEKLFLEVFGPRGAIQMPGRQATISNMIGDYSLWWKGDEPDGPRQLADTVVACGLPWFDQSRSLKEQAETWYARGTALTDRGYNWLLLSKLALTLYRMGELDEALSVLRKPATRTAIAESVADVARLRAWLERRAGAQPRA